MVRHHDDIDESTFAVGVTCRRCYASSTIPVDDVEHFGPAFVWACPACYTDDADGYDYTIADTYEVDGVVVATDGVEPVHSVDDHSDDGDLLTDTERGDVVAVEVEGASCADRARERGVARGTVTKTVARARRKIRGDA